MMLPPQDGDGSQGLALELDAFFKDGLGEDDEGEGIGEEEGRDGGGSFESAETVGSTTSKRSGKSGRSGKGTRGSVSGNSQRGGGGIQLRRETIARVQGGVTYQVKV